MGSQDHAALRRAEVGARLRDARERQGLSIEEVSAATRIPERHLVAVERGDISALPSPAYGAGFVRAYARILSLDAPELVRAYRGELAPRDAPALEEAPPPVVAPKPIAQPVIEESAPPPPPPKPLPILPIAIGLGALIAAVVIALIAWRPAPPVVTSVVLPDATPLAPAAPPPAKIAEAVALPAVQGGAVRLTAHAHVWLRVYEQGGAKLFDGMLDPGQSYAVPAGARDPRLSTGYPAALTISVGSETIAPLGSHPVSGMSLSPTALHAPRATATIPPAYDDADAGGDKHDRGHDRDHAWHHRHHYDDAAPDLPPPAATTTPAPAVAAPAAAPPAPAKAP